MHRCAPAFAVLPLEDTEEHKALLEQHICQHGEAQSNVSTVGPRGIGAPKVAVDSLRNGHHLPIRALPSPPAFSPGTRK